MEFFIFRIFITIKLNIFNFSSYSFLKHELQNFHIEWHRPKCGPHLCQSIQKELL